MGRRFRAQDEKDLEWFWAGGLALVAHAPSSHASVVAALERGTPEPGGGLSPAFQDNQEAYLKERLLGRRLAMLRLTDPEALYILRVELGPPPEGLSAQALAVALTGLGPRPRVLLVAPLARARWQADKGHRGFLEWLGKLAARTDEPGARCRAELLADAERLWSHATEAWGRVP
jgi:hypothetical protein